MTFEEALTLVEFTFQSKLDMQLTQQEKAILKAAWDNQNYSAVADNLFLSVGHIKDLASRLWHRLSNLLETKVTKSNFRYLLLEQCSTLVHNVPEIEPRGIYQREDYKGNILIVDQFIENLDFLSYALSKQGYKVHNTIDSNQALTTVRNQPPDIILLEVNLPDVNGYQLCSSLKADEATSDIPVIFFSSSHEISDKVKAFQVGAVDYITKPCQPEEAVARIIAHINLQQQKLLLRQKIEQQQQNTEMLQQSYALLTRVFNNSQDSMAAIEAVRDVVTGEIADFYCLLVNPIFAKLLGKKRGDFTFRSGIKPLLNQLAPGLFDKFVQVVETRKTLEQEFCWETDTHQQHYYLIAMKLGDGISITVREVH